MTEEAAPGLAGGGCDRCDERGSLTQVRCAVAAATALLRDAPSMLWQVYGAQLGELMREVDRLAAAASGLRVAICAEAVQRGEVAASQCANTTGWLGAHAPSLGLGAGAGQVARLVEQTGHKPMLAPVREAAIAGALPVPVALVVLSEFDKLRGRIVPAAHELVLAGLIRIGVEDGAGEVRRLRPALLARYGADDELQRDQDRAARLVALSQPVATEDGVWQYRFIADAEAKAILEAAIGVLSAPWRPDGARDPRSTQERRGQALVEVCRRVSAAAKAAGVFGGHPRAGGDPPGDNPPSGDPLHGPDPWHERSTGADPPGDNPPSGDPLHGQDPWQERSTGADPPGDNPPSGDPLHGPDPWHERSTGADRPGDNPPSGDPLHSPDPWHERSTGADPPGDNPPSGDPLHGPDPWHERSTSAGPPGDNPPSGDPLHGQDPWQERAGSDSAGSDPESFDPAMLQAALAGMGAGGAKATLMLTMPLSELTERVGAATVLGTTEHGTLLAPETARRIACDAGIIPVVLGTRAEVLDLGRTERLFSFAQARAVLLRDRHCSFPSCDTPAFWCQLHHVAHWLDGGATDLGNAALLCSRHHTIVHRDRLTATVTPTGVHWDTTPGSYQHALARDRNPAA